MKKVNYGIDAPKVIRNLFVISALLLGIAFLFQITGVIYLRYAAISFFAGSLICLTEGILMVIYAKYGKFRHRERMLNMIDWQGSENVLDVGTGLGLLMIGAAKRLIAGRAVGIDIWNEEDLSSNSLQQALLNGGSEKVSDKIEVRNQNIVDTDFQDNHFDIVLSNLCLHNISDKELRKKACKEICRILRQNGTAIISDFKYINEYMQVFEGLGMDVRKEGTYYFDTFPPLTIIKAVKK